MRFSFPFLLQIVHSMGIHDSHENVQALLYAKKELLGLIVAVSLLGIQRMFPELKQTWNTLQI